MYLGESQTPFGNKEMATARLRMQDADGKIDAVGGPAVADLVVGAVLEGEDRAVGVGPSTVTLGFIEGRRERVPNPV